MSDRLETLLRFVDESPEDPFPLYGLAMEYKRLEDLAAAQSTFTVLGERFPDYVPRYLIHGQVLESLGDEDRAREVYTEGLAKAVEHGEDHAEMELKSALEALD